MNDEDDVMYGVFGKCILVNDDPTSPNGRVIYSCQSSFRHGEGSTKMKWSRYHFCPRSFMKIC